MVRTIKIGNNTYDLKSSAYTMFAYKDITGRDLLKDINELNKKYSKIQKQKDNMAWLDEIMDVIEKVLKLAHIMIKEQKPEFKEYKDWLKDIEGMLDDTTWIMDVLEVGLSPFRGGILSAPKQ